MINWSDKSVQITTESILQKFEKLKSEMVDQIVLIDKQTLGQKLTAKENQLINEIFNIDPAKYGFSGPYLGLDAIPNDLAAIKNQKYTFRREIHHIETQYLRKSVFEAYSQMNKSISTDLEKKLLIDSAYRSPIYQCLTFLYYFKIYSFNFGMTTKRVAIPGYSEHCSSTKPAIDVITENGLPSDKKPLNFARSVEYRWLKKNASKFGFVQSYPKNNTFGIIFEPWHWGYSDN
ncbi:MAG: D-alanyl-D-alanine carboxypeptidase family protein [Candidatus Shapirobacteria bacterium]|jgi:D-alanyl-D-alanine carboxypeptidase